jgi:hypothetical protein
MVDLPGYSFCLWEPLVFDYTDISKRDQVNEPENSLNLGRGFSCNFPTSRNRFRLSCGSPLRL